MTWISPRTKLMNIPNSDSIPRNSTTGYAGKQPRSVGLLLGLLVLAWAAMRWRFFFGFLGYDDMWYAAYAAKWGAIPTNHWEVRIFFSGLIRLSTRLFGSSEFSNTVPSLLASLGMLLIVFRLGWKQIGPTGAFLGGLLFAFLPEDVFCSTSVEAVGLTSVLSSAGLLFLLEKRGFRGIIPAGICFGLAFFSHYYALYVVGAAAFAWLIHDAPRLRWKESVVLFGVGISVFLAVNSASFFFLTGDAFFAFKVSAETHLQTFGGIVYDFSWLIWPIKAFFFTNAFGFLLFLAALALGLNWKRTSTGFRFLGIFSIVFYLYTNWGTQSPFQYLPLWHLPRYWYPIAVPVCAIVGVWLAQLPKRVGGWVAIALCLSHVVLLMLAGTWGENVEVSKKLLQYTEAHSDQHFVADGQTLNEMFVLRGCLPPANVFPVRGLGQPTFYSVPVENQVDSTKRPLHVLVNRMQTGRNWVEPHLKLAARAQWTEIGTARYRDLAAFLPAVIREKPFMLRHPPPAIAIIP